MFQTKTLCGEYDFVWSGDSAIEMPKSDDPTKKKDAKTGGQKLDEAMRMFNETSSVEHLPLHPGRAPVVFKLSQLSGLAYTKLRDIIAMVGAKRIGSHVACFRLVELSLANVVDGTNADGSPFVLGLARDGDGCRCVHADSMADLVAVDKMRLVTEMGARIISEVLGRD